MWRNNFFATNTDSTMLSPTYFVTARASLVSQRTQHIVYGIIEGKRNTVKKTQTNMEILASLAVIYSSANISAVHMV